jgi:hypothetical protein
VPTEISRRGFLLASAGLAAAAACRRSGDDGIAVRDEDTGARGLSLVLVSYLHVAGIDQRVTFALIRGDEGPELPTEPVEVTFKDPDGTTSAPLTGPFHREGIELPYMPLRHRFEKPGIHEASTRYKGRTLTAAVSVNDASVPVPYPGKPLIDVPTPTTADHRGVEPICTRDPACPLHETSLDAALAAHRPVALLFSTPARCKSRLCGPVLENLLAVRPEFADRVQFVHAEIYREASSEKVAPAVEAYKLPGEPFLFLAGADGIVRERLDNAYDRAEVRGALAKLVAS